MNKQLKSSARIAMLIGVLFLTACSNKKMAKVSHPSAPPPPAAPTATLAATPNVIQQGQATTLTWQTTNATDITIEGLGTVSSSGSRSVAPGSSKTYTLVAKGEGGSKEAAVRITVNPVTAQVAPPPLDEGDMFARSVKDVFFDYDQDKVRVDELPVAQNDAGFLVQHPAVKVLIEGHCDERGSEEYNLALGTSRANSVKEALVRQGVDASRIKTVSYGKEKPFCEQDNESCWQANRRDHFVLQH